MLFLVREHLKLQPRPVLMLLELLLLLCAQRCEPTDPTSVLLLRPLGTAVIQGEKVTPLCRASYPPARGNSCRIILELVFSKSRGLLLTVSPSQPIEGGSMSLACGTPQPLQKVGVQFCFFKDGSALGLRWTDSPELRIPALTRKDSGSYWCEARTRAAAPKAFRSRRLQIDVRRIPVHSVSLETQPPGGRVMEGEKLVLVCLATAGTGDITFRWYRGALGSNLGEKTQRSLTAEFEIPAVREGDAETYYCAADNGHGPSLSGLVSIAVRVPVSQPVLTLKAPGAEKAVGEVVELHCEAGRGSPPIRYQFYHEDVPLGNRSAPFGGGASFNLSLTTEHSGNYSCEADNGRGAQRSEVVPLYVTVPVEDGENLTSTILEGLLGSLGLTTVALLFCCWLRRRAGRRSAKDPPRSPPSPAPRESTYLNSTAPVQQQPIYENVNVVSGGEVYSLVYYMQQERQSAAVPSLRTQVQGQDPSAIYSGVNTASIIDDDYENAV